MNKKIFYILLAVASLGFDVGLRGASDPRDTRTIAIDIDTTLTTCCATIAVSFEGTSTVINFLTQQIESSPGCPVTFIRSSDIGITGYTITTPGAYALAEDVIFNPIGAAAAITINADNVQLHLTCHSIEQGNTVPGVSGVTIAPNSSRTVISGGTLKKFTCCGIYSAEGASLIACRDVTIQNSTYGIVCVGIDGSPIQDLFFSGLDLLYNDTAIGLHFVNRAQCVECMSLGSIYAGFELINSFSNSMLSCSIENTHAASGSAAGISLVAGGNNRVENCYIDGVSTNDTFSGNSAVGILIGATENDDIIINNQISNVTTTSNAQPFGIEMAYTITALNFITSVNGGNSGETSAAWSSDGRYFAYGPSDSLDLFINIYEFAENKFKLIAYQSVPGAQSVTSVAWSPDGQFFVFMDQDIGFVGVYRFDGTQLQFLTSYSIGMSQLQPQISWSPNGSYIAIATGNTADGFHGTQILQFSFNENKASLNLVANTVFGDRVSWSPDSQFLAVGYINSNQVIIYKFKGNSLIQVASFTYSTSIKSVDWSPDGQFLAVGTSFSPNSVSVLRFVNNSLIPVANFALSISSTVVWSPDGKYLVAQQNGQPRLTLLQFTGATINFVVSINYPGLSNNNLPQWSPVGDVIVSPISFNFLCVTAFVFPTGNTILNNQIYNINGPALPIGQPGVSSGRGISASSANNLIIQNSVFNADLSYVFVNNIFEQFIANAAPEPNLLSNLSFPPL